MATKEVEAVLKDKTVIVPSQENADFLLQGGYGTPCEGELGSTLSSYEALYLLLDKRIQVTDDETKDNLDFQSLLARFRKDDAEAWTKYLVYRDLRSRGYVVRDGFGFGIDFRVYGRGEYGERAATYIVFAVCEGTPIPLYRLTEVLRFVHSAKKKLILAVVDRIGEIVYYSISQLSLY